jgi:hypothetical protein
LPLTICRFCGTFKKKIFTAKEKAKQKEKQKEKGVPPESLNLEYFRNFYNQK